jgi:hypothetical protein
MALHFEVRDSQVIHQTIDDEVIIVGLDTGNYYSLDQVGADVWNQIAQGMTLPDVVEHIVRRYGCGREEADDTVRRLVEELQRESLIRPAPGAGACRTNQLAEPEGEPMPFEPPVLHKYTDMKELLALDPIHEVSETGWPTPKAAGRP